MPSVCRPARRPVRRSVRRPLALTAAALLLAGTGTVTDVGAATAVPVAAARRAGPPSTRLPPVVELSARRLATARPVAAAKWRTGGAVDDPVRERQVLDTVARQARDRGVEPAVALRIFRDQIEANKDIQRALLRRWETDTPGAPSARPDLTDLTGARADLTEVRAEINRVNDALVRAIAGSARDRAAPYCGGVLLASVLRVRAERRLDGPYTAALTRSLRSVCPS
ncbi:gamma subclass chorismate mutase AroQ [Streptomyces sp. NPDC050804]|uniref:gamma subclass chorismate mutase AroQ n=1 Tax=Streptomyces sp. NPDC050804 TaxID=3154745 RepID=UPI003424CD38